MEGCAPRDRGAPGLGPVGISIVAILAGCGNAGELESDEGGAWSNLDTGTGFGGGRTDTTGRFDLGHDASSDGGGEPSTSALDDEFDDDLSGWDAFQPSLARIDVDGGALHLEPAARTVWFHGNTGVLVHKRVDGDFVMTSRVRARRLSDLSQPPPTPFRLGGLMARDPTPSNGENYVFVVIGADGNDLSVEHKTTRDGQSDYDGPPWPGAEAELRVCRVGATFVLLIRHDDAHPWQEVVRYDRPDLPPSLQLGPTAYANNEDPDVRVSFDFVRFAAPTSLEDCVM